MKIIHPRKVDASHKKVLVDAPREIHATRWDGKFSPDKKGFFLIKVEQGKILAGRVQKQRMQEVVSGKKAEDIYYEIIRRKLITKLDTAAYLGKELMRAEECLKQGKKYVQL